MSLLAAITELSELNTSTDSSIKLLLSLLTIAALILFLSELRTLLLTLGTAAPLMVLILSAVSLMSVDLSDFLST